MPREFLPQLRPSAFTQRIPAGIRSSLIDKNGKFVDFLNYNSPAATGVLPIAAMVANKLIEDGILPKPNSSAISATRGFANNRDIYLYILTNLYILREIGLCWFICWLIKIAWLSPFFGKF
jgi:hypothetical protein